MAVHVRPDGDQLAHHETATLDCICGPTIEWTDPDTGHTYPSGTLVIHASLDGREHREPHEVNPHGWAVVITDLT